MDLKEQIVIVCGRACSGKDTFAKSLSATHRHVDVGNIVRELTQNKKRVFDESMDKAIVDRLLGIELYDPIEVPTVITGIRQSSILKAIVDEIALYNKGIGKKHKIEIKLIWLYVPTYILKERYKKRQAEKDQDLTFEQVDERDMKLGLKELSNALLKNAIFPTQIINNYTRNENDSVQAHLNG